MRQRTASRLAWGLWALTVLLSTGALTLIVLNRGGNCCPNIIVG